MNYLKMYGVSLIIFVTLDAIWLGFIAKDLYRSELGSLLTNSPKWIPAILFYLIFLVGLVYFVINPGLLSKDIIKILIGGALFGLIAYATYDLTNLSTINNWSLKVTIIDLIWGTFISTAVSLGTYLILK